MAAKKEVKNVLKAIDFLQIWMCEHFKIRSKLNILLENLLLEILLELRHIVFFSGGDFKAKK